MWEGVKDPDLMGKKETGATRGQLSQGCLEKRSPEEGGQLPFEQREKGRQCRISLLRASAENKESHRRKRKEFGEVAVRRLADISRRILLRA